MSEFKKKYSFEQRKAEALRIKNKYSGRIPIIVELDPKSNLPPLDKYKYLVPNDITIGQFLYVVRKRIQLDSAHALYMFINDTLPVHSALVAELYHKYRDEDMFLYCFIAQESTFG